MANGILLFVWIRSLGAEILMRCRHTGNHPPEVYIDLVLFGDLEEQVLKIWQTQSKNPDWVYIMQSRKMHFLFLAMKRVQ